MKELILHFLKIYRALLPERVRHLIPVDIRLNVYRRIKPFSTGFGRVQERKNEQFSLGRALSLARDDKIDKALPLVDAFMSLLSERPDDLSVKAYLICSEVLRRGQRQEDAESLITHGIMRFPDSAPLWKEAALVAREARNYRLSADRWEYFSKLSNEELSLKDTVSFIGLQVSMHNHKFAHELCEKSLKLHPDASKIIISRALNLGRYVINHFNSRHLEGNDEYASRMLFDISSHDVMQAFSEAFFVCGRGGERYEYLRTIFVKSSCIIRHSEPTLIREFDKVLLNGIFVGAVSKRSSLYKVCEELFGLDWKEDRSSVHGKLRHALEEDLRPFEISSEDLRHLERVLLWCGFWEAASQARAKAAFLAMQEFEMTQDPSRLETASLLSIEYAAPEVSASWVKKLEVSGVVSNSRLKGIDAYQKVIAGDIEALREFWKETLTPEERILSGYLEGKSVAIVAPAPGEQLNGPEIESYDVVVRLNSLRSPAPDRQARHGARTDISAFNGTKIHILNALSEGASIPLADGVKFALFKHQAGNFKGRDLVSMVRRDRKKGISWYVGDSINHIPHLTYYLLGFPIAKIKIFNSNFFLSRNTHEASYGRAPVDFASLVFSDSLDASHRLASRLLSLGLISVDKEAESVLSLETAEYMRKMQELYVG